MEKFAKVVKIEVLPQFNPKMIQNQAYQRPQVASLISRNIKLIVFVKQQ